MEKWLENIFWSVWFLTIVKGVFVGWDFEPLKWFKYRGKYWDWYNNREEFEDFLKREIIE